MKGIRIRLEEHGIRATLFDLEADIMETVWLRGWKSFTVSDVHAELLETRDIAYTTVLTTVKRLFLKELLRRDRDGKRFVYRPVMGREEFIQVLTRDVLESLPDVGTQTAVALLVERVQAADSAAELDRLEALIQARRREIEDS